VNRASGSKIWWSLSWGCEPHCETWVPVFQMRPYKPRSRVTVGVARQRSLPAQRPLVPSIGLNLQPSHR
jgi:hypothetical protein